MKATVGQFWVNQVNKQTAVITKIDNNVVWFDYLEKPEAKNSRVAKYFHSVFLPYESSGS